MIMLCQNCGKYEATTHIKQIINGDMAETHLCPDCANHLGYGDMFSGFDFSLSGLLSGFLGDMLPPVSLGPVTRCEKCGCSFDDIARAGKVGCPECYRTFYDRLLPSIQRIHGKISHAGKTGQSAGNREKIETSGEKIAKLRVQMDEAVKVQNFERAAEIRDEIKKLEGENINE